MDTMEKASLSFFFSYFINKNSVWLHALEVYSSLVIVGEITSLSYEVGYFQITCSLNSSILLAGEAVKPNENVVHLCSPPN